jgi:hypothetical protein
MTVAEVLALLEKDMCYAFSGHWAHLWDEFYINCLGWVYDSELKSKCITHVMYSRKKDRCNCPYVTLHAPGDISTLNKYFIGELINRAFAFREHKCCADNFLNFYHTSADILYHLRVHGDNPFHQPRKTSYVSKY